MGPVTSAPPIVVTIPPLKLIIQEITGDPGEVVCLLPPGASPHTFELRPSMARMLASAKLVLYTDETIDGWAARTSTGPIHTVFDMVPPSMRLEFDGDGGHVHTGPGAHAGDEGGHTWNAHFWSDPLLVSAIVPELVRVLSTMDPGSAARYEANGRAFAESLVQLHAELQAGRPEVGDYAMVAFHPSWDYFFARYGLHVTAYIEPLPGKEPTPRAIQELQEALRQQQRRVILSEEQLPAKPAEVLAETLGAQVTLIDPLGGPEGRETYADFLRYNAGIIWEAFR